MRQSAAGFVLPVKGPADTCPRNGRPPAHAGPQPLPALGMSGPGPCCQGRPSSGNSKHFARETWSAARVRTPSVQTCWDPLFLVPCQFTSASASAWPLGTRRAGVPYGTFPVGHRTQHPTTSHPRLQSPDAPGTVLGLEACDLDLAWTSGEASTSRGWGSCTPLPPVPGHHGPGDRNPPALFRLPPCSGSTGSPRAAGGCTCDCLSFPRTHVRGRNGGQPFPRPWAAGTGGPVTGEPCPLRLRPPPEFPLLTSLC